MRSNYTILYAIASLSIFGGVKSLVCRSFHRWRLPSIISIKYKNLEATQPIIVLPMLLLGHRCCSSNKLIKLIAVLH